MAEEKRSTGYHDEHGKEVYYGDTVRHVSGIKRTITEENIKELIDICVGIGAEPLEGWEIEG